MPDTDTLTLHPRRGAPLSAEADLVRTTGARRFGRSAGVAVVGLLAGLGAVVLPPHGAWTLGAWALALLVARLVWDRTVVIAGIRGTCSACDEPFALSEVGAWSDDLWVRCPACEAPYRVERPAEAPPR